MRQIVSIDNPTVFTTAMGQTAVSVSFRFNTGPSEAIAIPIDQVSNLNEFFLLLNEFLDNNGLSTEKTLETSMIGPFTVHQILLNLGSPTNDSDILLVLDVAASRLAFRIPHTKLIELAGDIRPILAAASVPKSSKPN